MPQMSPLCWLCLFLFFTLLFILFMMMNYFTYYPSPALSSKLSLPSNKMPWKW